MSPRTTDLRDLVGVGLDQLPVHLFTAQCVSGPDPRMTDLRDLVRVGLDQLPVHLFTAQCVHVLLQVHRQKLKHQVQLLLLPRAAGSGGRIERVAFTIAAQGTSV